MKEFSEEAKKKENVQTVHEDIGEVVARRTQFPDGVVDHTRKRYQRPVVAASEHSLIFQMKAGLGEKGGHVAPTVDEMVVDYEDLVVPNETVGQGVQVDQEDGDQENNAECCKMRGSPVFHSSPARLGFAFVERKDSR